MRLFLLGEGASDKVREIPGGLIYIEIDNPVRSDVGT